MTKKVTFTLSQHIAHNSSGGFVLGDFNDWNTQTGIPLGRNENGDLSATIELETGRSYQYRYLLHDGRWMNDDRAHFYINADGLFVENCVVVVEEDNAPETKTEQAEEVEKVVEATEAKKPAATKAKPTQPTDVKKAAAKKETPVKKATAVKTESKAILPDHDLTKIEGIGPKVSELLKKAGINTFSKLSKMSIIKLKDLLQEAGSSFNVHQPDSWPKQAKLASAEKWDELSTLQKQLNSGK